MPLHEEISGFVIDGPGLYDLLGDRPVLSVAAARITRELRLGREYELALSTPDPVVVAWYDRAMAHPADVTLAASSLLAG